MADPNPPIAMPTGWSKLSYAQFTNTFGGTGSSLLDLWYFIQSTSVDTRVFGQAHVVLTPTKGNDIEQFEFTLPRPLGMTGKCKLIDWAPGEAGHAFSVSLGASPAGPVGALGAATSGLIDVEEAGPDRFENAHFELDIDDFSNAAATRVSVHFFGLWRFPTPNVSVLKPSGRGAMLWVEIDDWFTNSYYMMSANRVVYDSNKPKPAAKEKVARLVDTSTDGRALVMDTSGLEHVMPGQAMTLKARIYGTPETMTPVPANPTMSINAEGKQMILRDVGYVGDYVYHQYSAQAVMPDLADQVVVKVSAEGLTSEDKVVLPMVQPMLLGQSLEMAASEGHMVRSLTGEPGSGFAVRFQSSGDIAGRVLVRSGLDDTPIPQDANGVVRGVIGTRAPVIDILLDGDSAPIFVTTEPL